MDSDFDWEASERFTYCFPRASLPHYRSVDRVPCSSTNSHLSEIPFSRSTYSFLSLSMIPFIEDISQLLNSFVNVDRFQV